MLWRLTTASSAFKYVLLLVALLAAGPESGEGAFPVDDGWVTPTRAASESDDPFPLVVLDRVVDGKYLVFLVGPEEWELVVPVRACVTGGAGGWCSAAMQQDNAAARARIEEKLQLLRARGRPRRATFPRSAAVRASPLRTSSSHTYRPRRSVDSSPTLRPPGASAVLAGAAAPFSPPSAPARPASPPRR